MLFLRTRTPNYYTSDYYSSNYTTGNYIPYNFIKLSDSELSLEFNVAGIDEEDLDIEVKEKTLTVSANPKTKDTTNYIVNGLNCEPFKNTFTIKDNFEVKSASVKNGILTINMSLIVPEEKKPKKILLTH